MTGIPGAAREQVRAKSQQKKQEPKWKKKMCMCF